MDETNNIVTKQEEDAANAVTVTPVQVAPVFPSSFVNPMVLGVQNTSSPPPYTDIKTNVSSPPPLLFPQGVRTQQPMPIGIANHSAEMASVNDYLAWSIFNCLCCLWPLGVVTIILSCVISEKKKTGDYQTVKRMSTATAILNAISTLAGIGLNIFVIIYYTKMR
ncbi:unnamed protein product [Adineta ricciae]|uniref:Uncharacterized protein n=1 Tax=Adineta ricciae TaxID=249248 RepID=A0A815JDB9_ADIRI|nr:unnamed protein product [Adineta ricciae]CAF1383961.1 unnamed protein product [Adineta ricciae]